MIQDFDCPVFGSPLYLNFRHTSIKLFQFQTHFNKKRNAKCRISIEAASEATASEPLTAEPVPQADVEAETEDLLKQKGVTLSKEGKVMIPSQKLNLSEELCRVENADEFGKKKKFVCQVCDKSFLRKDKANYHIYHEHHDEFVLHGKGLPKILQQNDSSTSPTKCNPTPTKKSPKKKVVKVVTENEVNTPTVEPQVPDNFEKVPENVEKVPENIEKVPENVEKETDANTAEDLALFPPGKKYRKASRRLQQLTSDVTFLIEIQEEHRRLRRRRRLTDSHDALAVMKKYRAKKRKARASRYILETVNIESLKFCLKKDELSIVPINPENPLKIQISRRKLTKPVVNPEPTSIEKVSKPVEQSPIPEPVSIVPSKEQVPRGRKKHPEPIKVAEEIAVAPNVQETPVRRSRLQSKSKSLEIHVELPTVEAAQEEQIAVEQLPAELTVEEPVTPVKRVGKKKLAAKLKDPEPLEAPIVEDAAPINPVKEQVEVTQPPASEKRRGRASKKEAPVVEPELAEPEQPQPSEAKEIEPQPQTPEKKRGRPAKKEASFEQEEIQPQKVEDKPQEVAETVVKEITAKDNSEDVTIKERVVVQDPSSMNQSPPSILDKAQMPKKTAKGRGRAKKVLNEDPIETPVKAPAREVIPEEIAAENNEEGEAAPKRSLRKRGAAAIAEPEETTDQVKIPKLDESVREKAPKTPVEVQPEATPVEPEPVPVAEVQPVVCKEKVPEEKKPVKEPLKLIISNDKKEVKETSGLKIIIRSPEPGCSEATATTSSTSLESKYVVQSSNENPLKIKLKTSDKVDNNDSARDKHHHKKHHHHRHHHHKKGLKLKLLLQTSEGKKVIKVGGGEENKEKKKKKKFKVMTSLAGESTSPEKHKSLVLRIKSPNPSEAETPGGNGLHKFKIQKSRLISESSLPDNPKDLERVNPPGDEKPKARKLDEAIKKYMAKMTETPVKKKPSKALARKLSQSKIIAAKKKLNSTKASTEIDATTGTKLPPIKTKIVLKRPVSSTGSAEAKETEPKSVEKQNSESAKIQVALSSHEEVEKIEENEKGAKVQTQLPQKDLTIEQQDKSEPNAAAADKEVIRQELSVRVRSLQREVASEGSVLVTSSLEKGAETPIVAFSPEKKPSLFSQDSKDEVRKIFKFCSN